MIWAATDLRLWRNLLGIWTVRRAISLISHSAKLGNSEEKQNKQVTRTESLSQPVNTDATGLVNPSKSIANAQTRDPSNMYGLRRPNRDVELSASTPKSPSTKRVQTREFYG